jgi:hypothetical protein
VKLIPLAYAIMFSLFAVPVTYADPKKPVPVAPKKPVVAQQPVKPVEPKPAEPKPPELKPICGMIAGHRFTIPIEYTSAGAIFDADIAGEGCDHPLIIAGVYLNIQNLDPSKTMGLSGMQSTYLIVGAIQRPYELGARKAIDGDIVQRELARQTNQEVSMSSLSRALGKLNDGHYYGHEYTYGLDPGTGKMAPYKVCKTYQREDEGPESCEYLYKDETLGLAFRVGFSPNLNMNYDQVRAQAIKAIALLTIKG